MNNFSGWVVEALGENAGEIIQQVPRCITEAHAAAANAQEVGGLRQRTTFGSTFALAVFDAFVRHFQDLPGVTTYKPSRASYSLVVVGEVVLFPLHWARDLSESITEHRFTLSPLRQHILDTPARGGAQLAFDFAELEVGEAHDIWDDIRREHPAVRRVVIVAYAAGYESGLLSVHIGEGSPLSDGDIRWDHLEVVDISAHLAPALAIASEAPVTRFDAAPLPDPFLESRPAVAENPEAEDATPVKIDKTEMNE